MAHATNQAKKSRNQEFDTLVVGAGLSGLLAAVALEALGQNIALIEAQEITGGSSRAGQTLAGPIDHGLKFFPDSAETHQALDWLETVLGEKIERESIEASPINYDDGKFKPYVGFGGDSFQSAAEVEAYATHRYLRLSSTPKDWTAKLANIFTGTVLKQSHATRLVLEGGRIVETTLNGTKRILAREILYAGPVGQLPVLLGESALPPRVRQKLVKGDFWTSVNLDLVHGEPVTDSPSVHILKGANEEPTIGLFHPAVTDETGRKIQVSQWLTLIPRENIDEEEFVAGALKQIKRQLKRAYETAFDKILQERILVIPTSHGSLQGAFEQPGHLPKIENLRLTSAFLSDQRNTVGTLLQTRRMIEEIADLEMATSQADDRRETDSTETSIQSEI